MPTTRSRRIVRRAVLVQAGCVLLPIWSVGAWLSVSRARHDGVINGATAATLAPAFAPVRHDSGREFPGSHQLRYIWWVLNPVVRIRPGQLTSPATGLAPCKENGMPVMPASAARQQVPPGVLLQGIDID